MRAYTRIHTHTLLLMLMVFAGCYATLALAKDRSEKFSHEQNSNPVLCSALPLELSGQVGALVIMWVNDKLINNYWMRLSMIS